MSVLGNSLLLGAEAAGPTAYQVSRSLRFDGGSYLSRTPASAGNRKTWTWSGWVKRSAINSRYSLFVAATGGNNQTEFFFEQATGADTLHFYHYDNAYLGQCRTVAVFRDTSAWYHIVLAVDTTQATASNRCKIYVNGVQQDTTFTTNFTQNADLYVNATNAHAIGYDVGNAPSQPFYFSGYLADIWFLDGIAAAPSDFAETDATTGQWVPKTYSGSKGSNGFHLEFADNSAATAAALGKDTSGNGNNWTPNNFTASATVYSNSTTNVTNPKNAFDGSLSTSASNSGDPANPMVFSSLGLSGVTTFEYYTTDSGTYDVAVNGGSFSTDAGGSGWRSLSSPPSTISSVSIKNTAGSPNTAVVRAFRVNSTVLVDGVPANIDSLVDTPTSYGTDDPAGATARGNYCTLNPLDNGGLTLSNGNLDFTRSTTSWVSTRSTFGVSSGKWYWEVTLSTGNDCMAGVSKNDAALSSYFANVATGWAYNAQNGQKYNNGSGSAYGNSWVGGNDVVGVAFDADAGSIYFYKNGVVQNSGTAAFTGLTSGPYFPSVALYGTSTAFINFGQRPFAYQTAGTNRPSSDYKALCDTNLPSPVVAKPNTVMDVKLYTGNGSTQTVSGLNFSPDWIWFKQRNTTRENHLYDSVRGVQKALYTDLTNAEATDTDALSSFNSDGWTMGADGGSNQNGGTYVAWCWDAGTSTVTNTQGSITSQVRANASSGFSVVTFTSPTGTGNFSVGHGLGVTPEFVIVKSRDAVGVWYVYHKSLATDYYLRLNGTNAAATDGVQWGAGMTSSVLGFRASYSTVSGATTVAYAFSPVAGYSSMGVWTGNGSTDGPMIYTGFRPRFLLAKSTGSGGWVMYDSARDTYNYARYGLYPHSSAAEVTNDASYSFDFLSNGFKVRRAGDSSLNTNGQSVIYCAFAESPFQYARAR